MKKSRHTSIRVRGTDDDHVKAIIRAGFADDLASAVRFSLAIARRWIDDAVKPKATGR